MKIGLLTCSDHPNLIAEDRPMLEVLKKYGHEGVILSWDDPRLTEEKVRSCNKIIVRSPWNYVENFSKFMDWIGWLEKCQVPVFNPLPLIKWNIDKHYLLELAQKGVRTVAAEYVEVKNFKPFSEYCKKFETQKLVAKPTVSAGAANTTIVTSDDHLRLLSHRHKWILQPFISEIQSQGEWSLLFFAGEFSHAVVKRAREGDFRIQEKFGGTWSYQSPEKCLVEQVQNIVSKIPGDWLYARVDGVLRGAEFVLMELELFEPQLFLQGRNDLVENFIEKMTMH